MCFLTLDRSLNGSLQLPRCATDGTQSRPTVLLFLAVGVARALRVSHTCQTALKAGLDLFLVHYDDGQEQYRANFSWYPRVAYTYELRHTNYMHHLAHALLGRPHIAAEVAARYSHLLLPDEDIRLAPAHEARRAERE